MSEYSPGEEEASFSRAAELPTVDDSDLSPQLRSIEIDSGRETLEMTRQVLAEFRTRLLPTLEMGEKTKAQFEQILASIDQPEGVLINTAEQARYIQFELWDGQWIGTEGGRPTIEMGQKMVDTTQEWLQQAAERTGVSLDTQQLKLLAHGWLAWHELGHGFQRAYAQAAPGEEIHGRIWPADLKADSLKAGVSEPFFDNEGLVEFNLTAESERFAEGFGIAMLEQYSVDVLGLPAESVAALAANLEPQERVERMEIVANIIEKYGDELAVWNPDVSSTMFQELRDKSCTVNNLGYGSPHSKEQVFAIMTATSRWETAAKTERIN